MKNSPIGKGRLAVTRRRSDTDHAAIARASRLDEPGATHRTGRGCGTEAWSPAAAHRANHRPRRPRGSSDAIASCGPILGCSALHAATTPRPPERRSRTSAAPISRNLNDATASLSGWDQTRTCENRALIDEASDEAAPIATFAREGLAQAPGTRAGRDAAERQDGVDSDAPRSFWLRPGTRTVSSPSRTSKRYGGFRKNGQFSAMGPAQLVEVGAP